GENLFFLDGGVLNNKPFSSTLQAIFHHTQTRDVQRLLVYVEPDPEHFNPPINPAAPDVLIAASDGLISIPGYQSIAEDLDAIAKHNDWVGRYQEIESTLNRVSDRLMKNSRFDNPVGPSDLKPTLDAESDPVSALVQEQTAIYLESRLTQLRERVLEGILKSR